LLPRPQRFSPAVLTRSRHLLLHGLTRRGPKILTPLSGSESGALRRHGGKGGGEKGQCARRSADRLHTPDRRPARAGEAGALGRETPHGYAKVGRRQQHVGEGRGRTRTAEELLAVHPSAFLCVCRRSGSSRSGARIRGGGGLCPVAAILCFSPPVDSLQWIQLEARKIAWWELIQVRGLPLVHRRFHRYRYMIFHDE